MFATHQQPIGAPTMNFGSYEHFSAHGPDTSKATASQGMGFSDPSTVAAAAALYMQQQQQQQQPMGPQHQAALQLLQQNAMLMASNPVAMAAAAAALQQQQQQQQLPHQQHLAALSGLLANQFTATSHHGGHAKPATGTLPMPTQNFTMPFGQPPQQPPLSLAPLAGAPTSVYGGMQHQLQSLSAAASTATPFGGHFTSQMPQLSSQYGASSLLPTPQQQPQQFQYQQPQLQQQPQQMMHQQQPQSRTGAAPPPYGAGAGAPRHSGRGGPMTHTLNVSSSAVSAASNGSGSMTGASVPPPGTMGPNNSTVALAAYADPLSRLRRVAASVDHLGEASDEVHGRATLYEDYRTADSVPVEGAPPGRPSWKRTVEFVQVVVAQVSGPACREPAAVMDLLAQALLRCGMLRREDIWFLDTPRVNFKDGRTTGLMSVKVSPAAARVLLFLSRDSVAEPTPHVAAAHDLPIETACDAPHIAAMRGGESSGNGAGSMPLSLAIAHPRPRILFVSGFSVLLSLTPAGVEQLLTLETHHQARQQQHLPRSGVTFALPWRLCVQRYQSINAYVLPPLDPATGLPVAPTPSASVTTTAATGATAAVATAALPMPPLVTDSSLIFKQQDQSQITSAPSVLSMPRGDSPTSSRNSYPM